MQQTLTLSHMTCKNAQNSNSPFHAFERALQQKLYPTVKQDLMNTLVGKIKETNINVCKHIQ